MRKIIIAALVATSFSPAAIAPAFAAAPDQDTMNAACQSQGGSLPNAQWSYQGSLGAGGGETLEFSHFRISGVNAQAVFTVTETYNINCAALNPADKTVSRFNATTTVTGEATEDAVNVCRLDGSGPPATRTWVSLYPSLVSAAQCANLSSEFPDGLEGL
jgi:hypothetical protein